MKAIASESEKAERSDEFIGAFEEKTNEVGCDRI